MSADGTVRPAGDGATGLTDGERSALENLSRKSNGEVVGWINISDARGLAEKGLCERDRQGWRINPAGQAWLKSAAPAPVDPTISDPIQLRP